MYRRIGLSTFLICIAAGIVAGIPPERAPTKGMDNVLDKVDISNAPYTVQLRNGAGDIVCAGTLITAQHVLTAAQCFEQYGSTDLTVVAGATTKSDTGVQRGIAQVFKHDTYNAATFYNDAAVLKLQSPMELSRLVVIANLRIEPLVKELSLVDMFGWHKSQQDEFHIMRNFVYSKEDCAKVWKEESIATKYPDSIVCDGNGAQFPCTHVAGSGAMVGGQLAAIVIGGPGCADPSLPGALTSVYAIWDFVKRTVKATYDK